jgi:exopolysaccharide biosynthesis protein
VVIDGWQKGCSMGMSLRCMAELFRALGATDAVAPDGGGSSVIVVAGSGTAGALRSRLVTHPSDCVGQRPIANVLPSCEVVDPLRRTTDLTAGPAYS